MNKEKYDEYKTTKVYWRNIFRNYEIYDPFEEIKVDTVPERILEEVIDSMILGEGQVLDFGCGTGRLGFRALCKGGKEITFIDICEEAIKLVRNVALDNGILNKCNIVLGGVEKLKELKKESFDGIILSNVIDNITPLDREELINEATRLLKPRGRLFIKLNSYICSEKRTQWEFKKLDEDFYEEKSGLYFWNVTKDKSDNFFKKRFKILRYEEVYYKEYDQYNRVYILEKL
ncbi:class I SAM-dependent methyltransferase [Clostridium hydrogeniformans]|uniref:class I SAM-dependent methyltransferase n=1 Tax=Clostridium hydrogeniformans TaxID=349933 RepID=UPI000481F3FF|nr:class I SAM-dependent methyltransferase [Clostridium hydrogeniformans]